MRSIDISGRSGRSDRDEANWWRDAVVYQIYPRSFADSNGDGIGDLAGVTSRVPYLASLGIDAVWLSPFYPSALVDGGYDVDDYRDVDPLLGGLDDFEEMVEALHGAGLKVIVDIVPNHTSDRHKFFIEALASPPGSQARDRYIFRNGLGPDGDTPPSDWESMFGGSAWERVPDGQWYLHLFAKEQPDLNWNNREVRDDFLQTIRFWSDRGADGFRVDVAHGLAKELSEPLPLTADLPEEGLPDGNHPFWDRHEVHAIYAEWRQVFNEYQPPRSAVAEAWVHRDSRTRYASPEGLGQAFNFDMVDADWSVTQFRKTIADYVAEAEETGASSTWVLSNHDVVRHPTRYGFKTSDRRSKADAYAWLGSNEHEPVLDRDLGLRRGLAATLMMLGLPGSAYLYQGEELGLHEVGDIPEEALQDPVFWRSQGAQKGRDGCRVPIPWSRGGPSLGFGSGPSHLPQPDWFADCSVAAQESDPSSSLGFYRRGLALRRQLAAAGEGFTWAEGAEADVVHFIRTGRWHSITNFGPVPVALPSGEVVVSSGPLVDGLLPSDTTVWVVAGAEG